MKYLLPVLVYFLLKLFSGTFLTNIKLLEDPSACCETKHQMVDFFFFFWISNFLGTQFGTHIDLSNNENQAVMK